MRPKKELSFQKIMQHSTRAQPDNIIPIEYITTSVAVVVKKRQTKEAVGSP